MKETKRMARPAGLASSSSLSSFFSFAFVLLVLLATPAVDAQYCEVFNSEPAACAYLLDLPANATIYVANATVANQSQMASQVYATIAATVAFKPECQEAIAKLNCLANFMSCVDVPFIGSVPAPVCRSVCDNLVANCYAAFNFSNILASLPNCSALDGPSGQATFPDSYWNYYGIANVSCNPGVAGRSLGFEPTCAPGYAVTPYDDIPLACLPECPLPYYSDDQWDALWYLYALFGLLTIVVAIFVLPPYFLSPSKWHWPQQMNMWIMFCSAMLGLGNSAPLIFYGNNWRDVVCKNGVSPSGQTDSALCTFQAVFQIYWGFAGILWWLFLVAKAALLVNGFKTHIWAEMILSHVYCWGVPFISLTILLTNGKVGSGSPPICNYLVTGAGDEGWWIQSALLIPEAIVLVVGCCFMTALLYTLIKYEGLKGLRKKGRLLTYLFCFLIPNLYLEIYYYVAKTHGDHEFDITKWLTCLATYYDTAPCEDLHLVPNYPAQVVNVLLVASVIFSYMLIFGLKASVFQWWWALIKGIFTCDFKNFTHWWTDISTSQTSHSTTSAAS